MRPITKLLVANRAEIASRVMRSCRELGIATVAVYSDPDRDAPFVEEADEAVALGGSAPAQSYLRIDRIVEAARRAEADAIHPGYGFLAENADFARACAEAGITFVGPAPEAIERMGSKLRAKELMADVGVPVLAGLTVTGQSEAELRTAAERLGWPLLAKASAGGGGKGMRIVRSPDELAGAIAAARREAASAFGDETMFLERYLEAPRHVEIQIFGDSHGNVVHLFERECSIQRRHQKIIEEAPSPAVSPELRERMGAAAVAAGKALGYEGAGTVEFLLSTGSDPPEFFFLEVNTRLQVEHPVTEAITGLDLVRLQILVAEGQALPGAALTPAIDGHAIEARLYAEDPANDFLPVVGTLGRFDVPDLPGLRVDSGVRDGSQIGVHYDPMIAKVVAHAPTRAEAARVLARGLAEAELHGMRTNRELLVRVLRHPEFLAGQTDTHFLLRHAPAELGAALPSPQEERLHAVVAALAAQAERRAKASVQPRVPSGFRNNPSGAQEVALQGPRGAIPVAYDFTRTGLHVTVAGEALGAPLLHACTHELVDLEVAGMRGRYRVRRDGQTVYVNGPGGQSTLRELDRYPSAEGEEAAGTLHSPMPGVVLRVGAAAGDRVERGRVLVVIEAMKMEHEIVAPTAGTVSELRVGTGEQVDAGMVVAVIEEEHQDG